MGSTRHLTSAVDPWMSHWLMVWILQRGKAGTGEIPAFEHLCAASRIKRVSRLPHQVADYDRPHECRGPHPPRTRTR